MNFSFAQMSLARVVLGTMGLITNLFIIVATFNESIVGDFKWFILNLAIVETLYAINTYIGAILYFTDYPDGALCWLQPFLLIYTIIGSTYALLPITTNRFISVYFQEWYDDIYTKVSIAAICAAVHLIASGAVVPLCTGFLGKCGRIPAPVEGTAGGLCTVNISGMASNIYIASWVFTSIIAAIVIIGFYGAITVKIRQLMTVRAMVTANNAKQLDDTRMLMLTTVIQAILPIMLAIPFGLVHAYQNITSGVVPVDYHRLVQLLNETNPFINAAVSIYIVKPYKHVFMNFIKYSQANNSNKASVQQQNRGQ